jgi:hypothetical protein
MAATAEISAVLISCPPIRPVSNRKVGLPKANTSLSRVRCEREVRLLKKGIHAANQHFCFK